MAFEILKIILYLIPVRWNIFWLWWPSVKSVSVSVKVGVEEEFGDFWCSGLPGLRTGHDC